MSILTWFLEPRIALADLVALALVVTTYFERGPFTAAWAAGALCFALSVARWAASYRGVR